ncbi:DUF6274 family protein [Streptomyces sp. NPDC088745]|uniref:DUF6274 family protein n=1 Tax=Streptomyces sp. NPDC088745 TaxID=3365884 RepID=UPI00381C8AE8
MAASTEKHETRALLRAHLAAAQNYRHRTGRCPVCLRLLRLAMAEQHVEEYEYEYEYGAGYGAGCPAEDEDGTAQDESPPVP